jgi:hypothetical protein
MLGSIRTPAIVVWSVLLLPGLPSAAGAAPADAPKAAEKIFRAGASAVDITPQEFPVIVSGGMLERKTSTVTDRLFARCLVLDDGTEQIALVVVDSYVMPRALLDEAKALAHQRTGMRPERMLISATHTHSAPAVMSELGSDSNERYSTFLAGKIAESVELAKRRLLPARIGWAVQRDPQDVFCRRFLMKPGTAATNPFVGKQGDRVQTNPGYGNPNALSPTGSVDDAVTVIAVQSRDGKPLALLGNYSVHYVGAVPLSADYFGQFCTRIGPLIEARPTFVGILSNGASADAGCHDFSNPPRKFDYISVADNVARAAQAAYKTVHYYDWVPLVMEERLITLHTRVPTIAETAAAKEYVDRHGEPPRDAVGVFARETLLLSRLRPEREIKLQAVRIGTLGIAAFPNEVFGITGLKVKRDSPLQPTVNITLANGYEGFIPPPDQHHLGGYETWRSRTSCLEEAAEPKLFAAALELLEQVATRRAAEKPIEAPSK